MATWATNASDVIRLRPAEVEDFLELARFLSLDFFIRARM
jgi:hypothetical protein